MAMVPAYALRRLRPGELGWDRCPGTAAETGAQDPTAFWNHKHAVNIAQNLIEKADYRSGSAPEVEAKPTLVKTPIDSQFKCDALANEEVW